jgi:DNA-binding MarR family transcriptional regulator
MEVKILAKLDASPNKSFDAKDLLDQSEISKHSVPQVAGVLLSLHATKQILRVRRGRYQSVHRTDDTESTKIRMPKSQIELLRSFLSTDNKWVRPVDIGGTARSQHSVNLNKLHQKGFVDKQRRNQTAVSFLYAITDAGKDAISTLTSQYQ